MAQPTTPYFFGRDCPHLKEHVAHSCQLRGDGSWDKWRGPALRGEVAVYAAKARRHSIDQRARRVRVTTTEIPPLFSPHFIHRHRACVRAVACSTESCPFAAPRMISPDASFSIRS